MHAECGGSGTCNQALQQPAASFAPHRVEHRGKVGVAIVQHRLQPKLSRHTNLQSRNSRRRHWAEHGKRAEGP